jgi:hypothetical protein
MLFLTDTEIPLSNWKRSFCNRIEYPAFGDPEPIVLPDTLTEQMSEFSGFVCYETMFVLDIQTRLFLEISETVGSVEVFMNGETAGMQIRPPYRYELSNLAWQGKNYWAIEVAIDKERRDKKNSNIIGIVKIYTC